MTTYILSVPTKEFKMQLTFEDTVIETIDRYRVNTSHKNKLKLGILISGGVDSMVLLDTIYRIKDGINCDITVLHVEFNDFPSYYKATELVHRKALKYEFHLVSKFCDLKSLNANVKLTAREAIKDITFEVQMDLILTAHHQDDQIETILFRLLRGSGVDGICGMTEFSTYSKGDQTRTFGKPFLEFTKKDIKVYAEDREVSYIEDESNADTDSSDRNFLRNEIIPKLNARFSTKNIIYTAKLIQESRKDIPQVNVDIYKGKWGINEFFNLPLEHKVFVIKEYLRKVLKYNISKPIHRALTDTLNKDLSNYCLHVGGGYAVYRRGDFIVIDYIKSTLTD